MNTLRGTIRRDPQETLYRVRSPILFVRLVILLCNPVCLSHGPSSGKEQQCGSQSKMSGTRRGCREHNLKGLSQRTGRSIRDDSKANPFLCWIVFPPWRPYFGPKANLLPIRLAGLLNALVWSFADHRQKQKPRRECTPFWEMSRAKGRTVLLVAVLSLILCSDGNLIWQCRLKFVMSVIQNPRLWSGFLVWLL